MKRGTLLVVLVALCILGNAACGSGHHVIPVTPSANFTFYAIGEDTGSPVSCVAGVVAIATTASADGSFAVVGGVQDYNNGETITSPQPGGDKIMGGMLVLGSDGTGTLTLNTSNDAVGINGGTEIFSLVFPNQPHALIIQFDGINTSSGSIDLQTSTAIPSGSFAFTAAGGANTGDGFGPTVSGGVFTVASGAVTGLVDSNVIGDVTIGTAIPSGVTLSTPDTTFGRGTVNGLTGTNTNLNYYVVGPEVIRIIDVDSTTADTAVGSAYGQGANPNFSSGSIGQSVFSFSNSFSGYAAAGQFFTAADDGATPKAGKPAPEGRVACTGTSECLFDGVGDLNELFAKTPVQLVAANINGSYQVAANGYGSLTIGEGFGDTDKFGLYAVDPQLNILDPNDKADTTGGALLAEMDEALVGSGSIVPQTDITVDDFSGTYAGGGSGNTTEGDEFDFLTIATVTESNGTFSAAAALSDPFGALTGSDQATTDATINAPIVPDNANAGRLDLSPLVFATTNTPPPPVFSTNMAVGAYQASGSQLFWIETDSDSYFGGSLEQFPGTANDDAKKAKPNNTKWKH